MDIYVLLSNKENAKIMGENIYILYEKTTKLKIEYNLWKFLCV